MLVVNKYAIGQIKARKGIIMTITLANSNTFAARQILRGMVDNHNVVRTIFNSFERKLYTAIRESVDQPYDARKAKVQKIIDDTAKLSKIHNRVVSAYLEMIKIKEPYALFHLDDFMEKDFNRVTLGEVYFILWYEKMSANENKEEN